MVHADEIAPTSSKRSAMLLRTALGSARLNFDRDGRHLATRPLHPRRAHSGGEFVRCAGVAWPERRPSPRRISSETTPRHV